MPLNLFSAPPRLRGEDFEFDPDLEDLAARAIIFQSLIFPEGYMSQKKKLQNLGGQSAPSPSDHLPSALSLLAHSPSDGSSSADSLYKKARSPHSKSAS
jgi:hypothetical protein